MKNPVPDVEKFLYDLNRYLYRQQQREQGLDEQDDSSAELSRLSRHDEAPMSKHRSHRRLSWPLWLAARAEGPSESGQDAADSHPFEKRNSELINSLLGLPRVMKVVG